MYKYNSSTHINAYKIPDGTYIYTKDLLELKYASQKEQSSSVDSRLAGSQTPLRIPAWSKKLQQHLDKDFASYILWCIEKGFHIGVNPPVSLKSGTKNMQSALQHPEIIDDYLQKELLQEQVQGPFPVHTTRLVHINCFGVIQKTTAWKVVLDHRFILSRGSKHQ